MNVRASNLAKGVNESEELSGHWWKLDKGRKLLIRAVCRQVACIIYSCTILNINLLDFETFQSINIYNIFMYHFVCQSFQF